MSKQNIRSDTVTLLLSSVCNAHTIDEVRASRIRKCAKLISSRCTDKPFKEACNALRNQKNAVMVVRAVDKAVDNFLDGLTAGKY